MRKASYPFPEPVSDAMRIRRKRFYFYDLRSIVERDALIIQNLLNLLRGSKVFQAVLIFAANLPAY